MVYDNDKDFFMMITSLLNFQEGTEHSSKSKEVTLTSSGICSVGKKYRVTPAVSEFFIWLGKLLQVILLNYQYYTLLFKVIKCQ